jgi:hypothetical protein
MYLSPPHTTGIHQPLDQIFKSWHTTFNKIVARWCQEHVGKELARSTFAALFSEAWPKWTTPENILAAFRHCGISASGLNPDAIPAVKFIVSETMKASSSTTDRAADGEPEIGLAGDGVHAADPGYLALAWSLSAGDKVGTVTAYVHGGSGIENDETVSSCKAGSAVGVACERDAEVSGNALSVGRRQVRLAEALDVELLGAVVTDDPRVADW